MGHEADLAKIAAGTDIGQHFVPTRPPLRDLDEADPHQIKMVGHVALAEDNIAGIQPHQIDARPQIIDERIKLGLVTEQADAWRRHPEWLLVGSAGIARQVAGSANHPTKEAMTSQRGPILVIAGSPAPQTQSQINLLRGLGPVVLIAPNLPRPPMPPGQNQVIVVCTPPAAERDLGESARAVAEAVAAWAVFASGGATLGGENGGRGRGTEANEAGFRPGAIVLAGGATARLVCERLGTHGVRLAGELQPGIAHGHLHGGLWAGVQVVTKAGGFGVPETLLDVVHALGVSSVAERSHD